MRNTATLPASRIRAWYRNRLRAGVPFAAARELRLSGREDDMLRLLSLTLLCGLVAGMATAAATHPFSVHDMLAMARIPDPRVSPDGKLVAFSVSVTNLEKNKRDSDLHLAATDGSWEKHLTTHADGDTQPRWSPDGKAIYFVSTRSGSAQVWKIAIDGGEERRHEQEHDAHPVGAQVLERVGQELHALTVEDPRERVGRPEEHRRRDQQPAGDVGDDQGERRQAPHRVDVDQRPQAQEHDEEHGNPPGIPHPRMVPEPKCRLSPLEGRSLPFLVARRVRGSSGFARPHAQRLETPPAATRLRASPP